MIITKRQLRRIIKEAWEGEHEEYKDSLRQLIVDGEIEQARELGVSLGIDEADVNALAFVEAHYADFVDAYIRSNRGADEFMDGWLFQLDDEGVDYTQEDLEALVNQAVANGEMEEGEIFLGTKGA